MSCASAVRMVFDDVHEYGLQWEAICSVAEKLGPKAETVRLRVRRAEVDQGRRPGLSTDELGELKRLKRENAELRRANDILKAAASFFVNGQRDVPVGGQEKSPPRIGLI